MHLLSIGCFIVGSTVDIFSTTYYVDSSHGHDSNAGTRPSYPWKTIARVNAQLLKPGDRVLLRRGDRWHEKLRPHNSGAPGRPIVFGAYGSGARPVLVGSDEAGLDINIDNNEQSHIVYRDLELRGARQGLRLYAWRSRVRGITFEDSLISTTRSAPHGTMSAGVYASVGEGSIEQITIRRNEFHPFPTGPEHWGIYFVRGVTDFRIEENFFGPTGEDAICIWHSARGVVSRNRGGGNGENTIDIKDSHHVLVYENSAENDAEYNIVIHAVDGDAHNIVLRQNTCRRGGQAGKLTAGIALLSVELTQVVANSVEEPFGTGIYVKDNAPHSGNRVVNNRVLSKPTRSSPAVLLEQASGTRVSGNEVANSE